MRQQQNNDCEKIPAETSLKRRAANLSGQLEKCKGKRKNEFKKSAWHRQGMGKEWGKRWGWVCVSAEAKAQTMLRMRHKQQQQQRS